jgi:hypothetical protein
MSRLSSMTRWPVVAAVTVGVLVAGGAGVLAQRRGFGGGGLRNFAPIQPNPRYDGRFTFVRLRYGPPTNFAAQQIPWSHDYPNGEQHFMKIMNELTYLNPRTEETSILALDDPQLFKYPVAYLCEPGAWEMTEHEAEVFRSYLDKGGFLIVDDFRFNHWDNFEEQMRRILPKVQFFDLDETDPIFHDAFFQISNLGAMPNYYDRGAPIFRGIYENNDPTKRLMVIINYNTDISEYWEWSDTGIKPVNESNDAYKLGVNYIIYGMTH